MNKTRNFNNLGHHSLNQSNHGNYSEYMMKKVNRFKTASSFFCTLKQYINTYPVSVLVS